MHVDSWKKKSPSSAALVFSSIHSQYSEFIYEYRHIWLYETNGGRSNYGHQLIVA